MDRRQFLTATAGVTAFPTVVGGAASRPVQSSFGPLGRVSVRGIKEAVVDDSGTVAFAATDDGFATIDVSDPANPTVLAERRGLLADRPNGPMHGIYDVKYDDDTLLVVGPANSGSPKAALFYDVSDPAAPERIGVHDTGYPIHNSFLLDGTAYLTAHTSQSNGLVLVDIDGGDPAVTGSWSITNVESGWNDVNTNLWVVHDVYVRDDTAYVAHWDAGTWILDVSDPAAPEAVTQVRGRGPSAFADMGISQVYREQLQPPGNDHYVAVNADASLLGIGMESWDIQADDGEGGPGGIELWDISTPTDAQRLTTIEPPASPNPTYRGVWTTAHNFDFHDDRLYSSWYQGGVRVFDVADPADPVEIAAYRNTPETSFWTARYATADCVIAASGEHPSKDLPDRLYTFPVPENDGPISGPTTPTPGETTPESTTATESTTSDAAGGGDSGGAVPNMDASSSTVPPTDERTTGDTTATGDDAATTTGTGPGFGVLGALAGLGLGVRRVRDRDED